MFRAILAALAVVIGVIVLSVGLMFLTGTISMLTAPFRGEVEKRELVEADGSYRIAAYDEFYKLCSSVQSKNEQIEILEDEMDATTDPARKLTLQSGITAQKNTKSELVNEYNSKAAGTYTKGQFKDSSLPYELPREGDVTCNA